MPRLAILLCYVLLFSSCATVFNQPYTTLQIIAPSKCDVICQTENAANYEIHSPALPDTGFKQITWLVERSASPLLVRTRIDSFERQMYIRANRSAAYYMNFLVFYGIGALVDYWNPKSYGYPAHIKLKPYKQFGKGYNHYTPAPAYQHELSFAVPFTYITAYRYNYLTPVGTPFSAMVAYNYWHKRGQFLSLEFNASQKADLEGFNARKNSRFAYPREKITSTSVTVSNYHRWGRLDVGYGLYCGIHSGRQYYVRTNMTDFNTYNTTYISIGAHFSAQFKVDGPFYIGCNYQPQFLQLDKPGNFMYEHQFNVGLVWRVGFGERNSPKVH